jgi:hypothetical protein
MQTYGQMNSTGPAKRSQFRLLPAEVALDLIDGRGDTGDAQQIA